MKQHRISAEAVRLGLYPQSRSIQSPSLYPSNPQTYLKFHIVKIFQRIGKIYRYFTGVNNKLLRFYNNFWSFLTFLDGVFLTY